MHTFTEAIAISFGLVPALSVGKSISTVAEHRQSKRKRKNERERERESFGLAEIFLDENHAPL